MLNRAVEAEILPYCREQGIGVVVYSPMQAGLLTGAFSPERLASEGSLLQGAAVLPSAAPSGSAARAGGGPPLPKTPRCAPYKAFLLHQTGNTFAADTATVFPQLPMNPSDNCWRTLCCRSEISTTVACIPTGDFLDRCHVGQHDPLVEITQLFFHASPAEEN